MHSSIDLDEIVQNWAWKTFSTVRHGSKEKAIKQEQVTFDIIWDRVDFVHSDAHYKQIGADDTDEDDFISIVDVPVSTIIFNTSYSNNTDKEQTYSISTQRTTRNTCNISLSQGYSSQYSISANLSIPGGILELGAGYQKTINLSKNKSQEVSHEMTWTINMNVAVPVWHQAHAHVNILEKQMDADFEILTRASGRVAVILWLEHDENGPLSKRQLLRRMEGDFARMIKETPMSQDNKKAVNVLDTNIVELKTSGTVNFRFGVKQKVVVTQENLDPNHAD